MLIKMLLGNRKTEAEFKKYITMSSLLFLFFGYFWDYLLFGSNSLSDYALGLVLGLTIGVYVLSIYYFSDALLILNVFTRCILLPMMSEINRF